MIQNNLFEQRVVFRLSASFILALLVLVACKKKDSSAGVATIKSEDLLNSVQVDTFSLVTYTELEDSVITSTITQAFLGSYNDPVFGTVNAGFYTQLRLPATNPSFGNIDDIIIDSFVMGMVYSGYYGDLSAQKMEVFELTDTMSLNSLYYSFSEKAHTSINLVDPAKAIITPDPLSQIVIDTAHVNAQMRLYLDTNLARSFLNEVQAHPSTFESNENFISFFKGLYVKVDNGTQAAGKGGVLTFNLFADDLSKLTMYYTQDGVRKTYDFLLNSGCAHFSAVEINHLGSQSQSAINNPIGGKTQYYTQAMKSRAVLDIPGIKNLPKNCVIHEATLTLPVEYQVGFKYGPGSEVSVAAQLADGSSTLYQFGQTGSYDDVTKNYTINIRSFVQDIVSEKKYQSVNTGDYETLATALRINPKLFNSSVHRIIFNGSNTLNKYKPKLILKYTEF